MPSDTSLPDRPSGEDRDALRVRLEDLERHFEQIASSRPTEEADRPSLARSRAKIISTYHKPQEYALIDFASYDRGLIRCVAVDDLWRARMSSESKEETESKSLWSSLLHRVSPSSETKDEDAAATAALGFVSELDERLDTMATQLKNSLDATQHLFDNV